MKKDSSSALTEMSNSVQTANKSTYGLAVKLLVWKRKYVFRNGRRIIPMMRNSSSVEFCMPFQPGWGTTTSKITFATYFIMKTFLMKISSSLYLWLLLILMSEMNNLSSIKRKSTKFSVTKLTTILFSLRYSKYSANIPKNLLPSVRPIFFQIKQAVSHACRLHSAFLNKQFQKFPNFTVIKFNYACALLCVQNIWSQKVFLSPQKLKKLTGVAQGMTQVPSVACLIINSVVLVKTNQVCWINTLNVILAITSQSAVKVNNLLNIRSIVTF